MLYFACIILLEYHNMIPQMAEFQNVGRRNEFCEAHCLAFIWLPFHLQDHSFVFFRKKKKINGFFSYNHVCSLELQFLLERF